MANSVVNPLYPRPTHFMSAGTSTVPAGQQITVTSTLGVAFSTFNSLTDCIVLDIQTANVWCTFDGTTPSSTFGHILYAGSAFTWSKAAAQQAKFVATTTTNATIYASEFNV